MLSVQVHPGDTHTDLLPVGETGKTEAWVVLEAGKKSRIYAGLKPGTTEVILRQALASGGVADRLAGFTPKPGDGVFIPAGTVHTLGGDIVVFEVQQNSDVTFRLYDWGHIDAKTGQPRPLQVHQALACVDFGECAGGLVAPVVEATGPVRRERLFHCEHFWLSRLHGDSPFTVGAPGVPRVLVCIEGAGQVEHGGATYAVGKGDVVLLPAATGPCTFRPCSAVIVLEIEIPE
jgi:mannose-6-phosphate isomerase